MGEYNVKYKESVTVDSFIGWYSELSFDEQLDLLIALNEGDLSEVLEEEDEDAAFLIEELMRSLEEIYLADGKSEMISFLHKNGLSEQILTRAIVKYVEGKTSLFLDASILRDIEDGIFEKLIYSVISHFYVEKDHMSPKRIKKELQLDIEENVVTLASKIINYGVTILYMQELSYFSFGKFLRKELGLSKEKVQIFIENIKCHQEQLDRYFILKTLNQLRRELNDDM
jgi:hypothetical protein